VPVKIGIAEPSRATGAETQARPGRCHPTCSEHPDERLDFRVEPDTSDCAHEVFTSAGRGAGRARQSDEGLAARIGAASRQLELENPDRGLPLVDRVINRTAELLGVGLLGGILGIVFANALSRYLLNYSFVWAEEVVISLVPWLAVTGLFLSVRRRQLIRDRVLSRPVLTRSTPSPGSARATSRRFDVGLARLARLQVRRHLRR
jgi:hypothetical protein